METLGPVKLKKVLILLDNMLPAIPVDEYLGPFSGSFPEASM